MECPIVTETQPPVNIWYIDFGDGFLEQNTDVQRGQNRTGQVFPETLGYRWRIRNCRLNVRFGCSIRGEA